MKINITYTHDVHDCEDYGNNYAQGAIVTLGRRGEL